MWTSDQHAQLVAMAAARKSSAEIGAALGKTRNAVLGRAHRHGIRLFGEGATVQRRPGPGRPKGSRVRLDHPMRRGRPKGACAFSLDQRAAAVAARLAGASWRSAAGMVGASAGGLRLWLNDPEVMDAALATLQVAKREAFRAKQERLAIIAFLKRNAAEHNERVLAGLDNRTATIARRWLAGEPLAAIATDYGFTRERARQLFMRAVKAGLKEPPGVSLLRDRPVTTVQEAA